MSRILTTLFLMAGTLLSGPAFADACSGNSSDPAVTFPGTGSDNIYAVRDLGDGTYGLCIYSPTTIDLSAWTGGYAIADLNGDGSPDLLLGLNGKAGGGVQVFLNDGTGSGIVVVNTTLPTGSADGPYVLGVTDVNGDGHPDILTANDDDTISVMLNDGTGGFLAAKQYAAGTAPAAMAAVDLNGDGHPDLVTWNYADTSLSVLLNNGDGSFATPSTYSLGAQIVSISISDVNNDGNPDIVVDAESLYGLETVVLQNNGDGTFTASFTISSGGGSSSSSGDLSLSGFSGVTLTVNNTGGLVIDSSTEAAGPVYAGSISIGNVIPPAKGSVTVTNTGGSTKTIGNGSGTGTKSGGGKAASGSSGGNKAASGYSSGGGAMDWLSLLLLGFAGLLRKKRG